MVLGKDDYVYVPQLEKFGRIVDIYKEGPLYTVKFLYSSKEDMDFEESQLVKLEVPDFKATNFYRGREED